MASFTDRLQQYNPYVEQLPVEDMAKIGMLKQQKYDEGIQKIQTNIDNIAGLDVIRDVDKAYLQSRLNQLGNDLKFVGAGDFSDFQLVNSVSGMTNQISKDPNIQNAISSTAKYRKGLENMSAMNKEGKGSASNDWLFKTEANTWLNSSEVEKSFNSDYKPYSNYSKNALEVIKGLVKNENIKDISLEYDENGNVTGVLDATTRTKIAGITPERIQAALMTGLTPNDFQQLQTDGRYSYSNTTPTQLLDDITKSYDDNYSKYRQQRDTLVNSLDSTTSIPVKQRIQKDIADLNITMGKLKTDYKGLHDSLNEGQVEAVKSKLFSTKWINTFSQTFSHQETSMTNETNAYQQPKQFRETKKIEWEKYNMDYDQKERFEKTSNYYKERAANLADSKEAREAKAAEGYGGVPVAVDQNDLPNVSIAKVQEQIKIDESSINAADAKIMESYDKAGNKGWLDQQRLAWQNSPSTFRDPVLAKHFSVTEPQRREVITQQIMVTDLQKQADAKYGTVYDKIPEGAKSVIVPLSGGKEYVFNPREFVEFNQKVKNYVTVSGSGSTGGGSGSVTYNDAKAKAELTTKEYYLYQAYKNENTPAAKVVMQYVRYYNKNVNQPYSKILQEKTDFIGGEIKKRTMAMQGMEYGVPLGNEEQKTTFGNALVSFANLADSQKGGLPNSPGLSTKDLREVAADLQNATVKVVEGTKFAPAIYQLTASDKNGKTVTFRIPPEAYQSVFKGRFDADPAIEAARPYTNQMTRMNSDTTSLDGKITTPANSFLGRIDFPSVQLFGISGNVIESDGLYSVRVNITNPLTKEIVAINSPYPLGGMIDKNKIAPALQNLSDIEIFEMVYGRTPTARDLKLLKEASKNPL